MNQLDALDHFLLTKHAREEMLRRQISEEEVKKTLATPEQIQMVRENRKVYQSRFIVNSKSYLLRIIVDVDRNPPRVITVYRTSKIDKYWRIENESDL